MTQLQFTLTQQQYEALVALAREGTASDPDKSRRLDEFLKSIEKANGVLRDAVWVRWQEMDEPLPPTARFPETWPPEKQWYIELITRRVAKVDVEEVLRVRARNPINVMCTRDPGARVGWAELDAFFVN